MFFYELKIIFEVIFILIFIKIFNFIFISFSLKKLVLKRIFMKFAVKTSKFIIFNEVM